MLPPQDRRAAFMEPVSVRSPGRRSSTSPRRAPYRDADERFRAGSSRMRVEDFERWNEDDRFNKELLYPNPFQRTSHYRARSHGDDTITKPRERGCFDNVALRSRGEETVRARPASIHIERSPSPQNGLQRLKSDLEECIQAMKEASSFCASRGRHYPDGLTATSLASVAERLEEQAFRLAVWRREAGIAAVVDIGPEEDETIALIALALGRLKERVDEVHQECKTARSADFEPQMSRPAVRDESPASSNGDEDSREESELLGTSIEQNWQGIELQGLQSDDQSQLVRSRVAEIKKYFGTEKACKTYHVNEDLSGHAALVEAREIAAGIITQ
ncbi:hypothetical protein LTR66_009930 [Elasticomyces elasticus]|nr:hypothetical protein LTR66_009930 [Elasticomyces elasticus]